MLVPVGGELPSREELKTVLFKDVVGEGRKDALVDFVARLFSVYVELHFAYLEINPLVAVENAKGETEIFYLDMAAKLDQVRFLSGFGRAVTNTLFSTRLPNSLLVLNGLSLVILPLSTLSLAPLLRARSLLIVDPQWSGLLRSSSFLSLSARANTYTTLWNQLDSAET